MSTINVNRMADSQGGVLAPISSVMRNRIINGAMVVNQRGGTVTFGTSEEYFVDRWTGNNGGGATITAQQSTTAPSGFINSLLVNTSVGGSPTSGQLRVLRQKIEGLNTSDLGWSTAGAKPITVSFWIRSNVTGTFACYVTNSAYNRSQVNTFVVNSANTFEYKTVNFQGDTSGTWLTTNGVGIEFGIDVGSGTNFNATAGVWNAALDTRTSDAVTLSSTTSNNLYLTGVQFEVGTQATSFEYRQYGQELALCQRYYWKTIGSGSTYPAVGAGGYISTTNFSAFIPYPVQMRATPTFSISSDLYIPIVGFPSVTAISANYANQYSARLEFTTSTSVAGYGGSVALNNSTASFIAASAEL